MIHNREQVPAKVWTVLELRGNAAEVVAVKSNEGAARIAAKVLLGRGKSVHVSGPHEVASDYT